MKWIQSRRKKHTAFFLILVVLVIGLLWVNYKLVQDDNSLIEFRNLYLGTRAFVMEGASPYSESVLGSIQTEAQESEGALKDNQIGYRAPLYSVVLLAPFSIFTDYEVSRAIWVFLLQIAMVGTLIVLLETFRWKPSKYWITILIVLSISWFYSTQALSNGSPVVFAMLALFLTLLLLVRKQDELAGFLLAIALIKPEIIFLPVIFFIIWGIRQQRTGFLSWFVITLAMMIGISLIFLRDWIPQYLFEIIRLERIANHLSLGESLSVFFPGIGFQLKWLVGLGLTGLFVYEMIRSMNSGERYFIWFTVFALIINQWVGTGTRIDRFYLMIPGVVIIGASIGLRWIKNGELVAVGIMTVMVLVSWGFGILSNQGGSSQVSRAIEVIVIPTLIVGGLYWTKWWFTTATNQLWETTR